MPDDLKPSGAGHSHMFLGDEHAASERRTWAVIWLCGAMMALEVIGGLLFGSIALVADGLHMSTHAGALLLAALAYRYARRHAEDARFTFGTGKLGDLAGFTSAIILAMIAVLIAVLIGYESLTRLFAPVPIHFAEAIPIACLGLAVNIGSAWLLGAGHDHGQGHEHQPRCRSWSSPGCCWHGRSAGFGWTRWRALSAQASSRPGLTDWCATPVPSCST